MQSRSFSGSALVEEANDDERIVYSYATDPVVEQRVTNPRSDGTAILLLNRNGGKTLSGKYFTDRFTAGAMQLAFHSKKADSSLP